MARAGLNASPVRRASVVAVLLLACVAAVLLSNRWLRERAEAENARERERENKIRALEGRLVLAERTIAAAQHVASPTATVEPTAEVAVGNTPSSAVTSAIENARPALSDEELVAQARAQTLRRASHVQAVLSQESRDSAWARATEDHIDQVLHGPEAVRFPSVRLLDTDCRSTLCSIHVAGPNPREVGAAAHALARLGRSFGYIDTIGTGEAKLNAFLVRDGHELPSPDEDIDAAVEDNSASRSP